MDTPVWLYMGSGNSTQIIMLLYYGVMANLCYQLDTPGKRELHLTTASIRLSCECAYGDIFLVAADIGVLIPLRAAPSPGSGLSYVIKVIAHVLVH